MNAKQQMIGWACGGLLLLGLSGCASTTYAPRVTYPVTYQIPVGNTNVSADSGGQNLEVVAQQSVEVIPRDRLYFRVSSPVTVTMRIYTHADDSSRLVEELRGNEFTSSVVPYTDELKFTFAVAEANSSGTVQFTLSDRPLAPAVADANR